MSIVFLPPPTLGVFPLAGRKGRWSAWDRSRGLTSIPQTRTAALPCSRPPAGDLPSASLAVYLKLEAMVDHSHFFLKVTLGVHYSRDAKIPILREEKMRKGKMSFLATTYNVSEKPDIFKKFCKIFLILVAKMNDYFWLQSTRKILCLCCAKSAGGKTGIYLFRNYGIPCPASIFCGVF